MAFDQERESIAQIVDQHHDAPMTAAHSTGSARRVVARCNVLKIKPPLVIMRFLDRVDGPQGGVQNKLARDFHGKEYKALTDAEKQNIDSLHSRLAFHNPATGHPYTKPGFTFAQGHNLLVATYREETKKALPHDLQAALIDFRNGLEHDLDDAAKRAGFYKQYSDAQMKLRMAAAAAVGAHNSRQNIPIVAARR